MLVRPDDGRVDHDVFEVRVVGHRHEQPVPNAILRPARKTNEHTVPVSENFWKITPRRTRSRQPENGFDKQPIVGSAPAWIAHLSRQMRRHPNPLRISQHQANRHSWLPTEKELESDLRVCGNPECQRALRRRVGDRRKDDLRRRFQQSRRGGTGGDGWRWRARRRGNDLLGCCGSGEREIARAAEREAAQAAGLTIPCWLNARVTTSKRASVATPKAVVSGTSAASRP